MTTARKQSGRWLRQYSGQIRRTQNFGRSQGRQTLAECLSDALLPVGIGFCRNSQHLSSLPACSRIAAPLRADHLQTTAVTLKTATCTWLLQGGNDVSEHSCASGELSRSGMHLTALMLCLPIAVCQQDIPSRVPLDAGHYLVGSWRLLRGEW